MSRTRHERVVECHVGGPIAGRGLQEAPVHEWDRYYGWGAMRVTEHNFVEGVPHSDEFTDALLRV